MESRLDKLPDEILISILQFMEYKDAVKTSVVSKNFQKLFTHHTCLDFDGHSTNLLDSDQSKDEQKLFIGLVNRALKSYRGYFMESFRVHFPLKINDRYVQQRIIDQWVMFVTSKGVTTLELDFSIDLDPDSTKSYGYNLQYRFPWDFVRLTHSCESRFRFLKYLRLKRVNISITAVLYTCTVLELLHVEDLPRHDCPEFTSESLKVLIIKGTKSKLVCSIDRELKFQLPNLVEASFDGDYCDILFDDFSIMNSLSSHLSKLCLEGQLFPFHSLSKVPIFEKVKELTLRINILSYDYRLFIDLLTILFKACPSLQTIVLETKWLTQDSESIITDTNNSDEELELSSDSDEQSSEGSAPEDVQKWLEIEDDDVDLTLIPNLQSLEWRGAFRSNIDNDVSVALYIVKNATKLEKMVFDPHSLFSRPSSYQGTVDEVEDISRENARQLAVVIPKHIEIVIL